MDFAELSGLEITSFTVYREKIEAEFNADIEKEMVEIYKEDKYKFSLAKASL